MQKFLTPEEVAQHLRVEISEVTALIGGGKMRAVRIGDALRIPETEFDRLLATCAATPADNVQNSIAGGTEEVRWCKTRTGTPFRISGSVATGADIWPGKMRYPIHFPKLFMDAMLRHFKDSEVAVGGSFDAPTSGSLGAFIQQELKTKMNPAVYVAGLLIDEGYAEASRRGYVRFRDSAFRR